MKPTKDELKSIGAEIAAALLPLRSKHPGLDYTLVLAVPRPDSEEHRATTVVSTVTDPHLMLRLLVHGAREIKEQMIDPYTVPSTESEKSEARDRKRDRA